MDSSPAKRCFGCRLYLPTTAFPTNLRGQPYSHCRACSESRRRAPLQESNANAPLRTRSGRKRAAPALEAEPSRPKRARIDRNLPQEEQDAIRAMRAAETAERRQQEVERRQRERVDQPAGFRSKFNAWADPFSLGPMDDECIYCGALHFRAERVRPHNEYTGCCVRGDGVLEPLRPVPVELRRLLQDQTPRARLFRKDIRQYNAALAFTSVSYNKDLRLNLRGGIQCVQIHGELFHFQGPLVPENGVTPAFAQLFFYDSDYATDIRMDQHPGLDRSILTDLLSMLEAHNPFISLYQTARERLREPASSQFRLLLSPQLRLVMESGADRRRENLPTTSEVAGILSDEYDGASYRDIVLAVRNPRGRAPALAKISPANAAYMPLHYVLLFPAGDLGWHFDRQLRQDQRQREQTRLQQRQFYRYRLHTRNAEFSPLFYSGRLFQQYCVDAFASCEATALDWLRHNQDKIRSDVYEGLQDNLVATDIDLAELGRKVILPSSFTGGDRFMQQLFQDSMAIVRHCGTPTFFITMTANPHWPEIVDNLFPGQQPTDRPDLTARVFHLKVKELLADLKGGIVGPYRAHVYTIEYQKRGLPHVHILVWLTSEARFLTADRIDEVICAELPPEEWGLEFRELVMAQMTHGPCGDDYPGAPCMARKFLSSPLCCQKGFPKPFAPETVVHEDRYPEYRRRNDGVTWQVPKPGCPGEAVTRGNRWVVPYNPYLLRQYKCHINVEVCATVQAVKYIHKYVYKGSDRTTAVVSGTTDEITRYVTSRYVGPSEAVWRVMEFPIHQEYPPVTHLPVHLQGKQTVYFKETLTPSQLAEKMSRTRSMLMAFFLRNSQDEQSRQYLYTDFPAHYTWKPKTCTWDDRERCIGVNIGRMYHCNPVSGERYYLRLLLTTVRGPKSFEELYYFNGTRHPTFQAACIARGLAEDDQEWYHCFDEAILFTIGRGLRTMFLTGLRQNLIAGPLEVWNRYRGSFCEDLKHRLEILPVTSNFPLALSNPEYDYGLWSIAQGLVDLQRSLTDVSLPENCFDWSVISDSIAQGDQQATNEQEAAAMQAQLNGDQKACFDTIVGNVTHAPETAHFYLQGPGGTGKTFLYKALYHYFAAQGKKVLCVASTGIAALLLPNGRTSHSQFKIPINLNEVSVSSVSKKSVIATELRSVFLIIWDEVPMQHKYCFEVVHRLLADLRSVTDEGVLFGGVPTLFGGDFAQILPVVPQGSRSDIIRACLQRSFLWSKLERLYLRTNMRVRNTTNPQDQAFTQWLKDLSYTPELNGLIELPEYILRTYSYTDLISKVYPLEELRRASTTPDFFKDRVILSALNRSVSDLNYIIIHSFPGTLRTYSSIDSTDLSDDAGIEEIPVEHLQSIDLPSLPPSQLTLKVGVPVMLLRNLCPKEGLCNGSRIVVTSVRNHCFEGRLLGGDFDGELRTIPRIKLSSGEKDLTFTLTRKQFPVRVCFAMTINKSQGQSFKSVGLDLRAPVFSHGQFYVAVSRVSSAAGLYVLLPGESTTATNIVWPEILQDLS